MPYMEKIIGFPNYCVTSDGKIWSNNTQRFRKCFINPDGYLCVTLFPGHIPKLIHRIVLESFVGLCPENAEACHNNGNKLDNRLENLRWDTHVNNILDRIKHGRQVDNSGSKHGNSKLKEQDVRIIIYMWNTGLFSQKEIGETYNVHQSVVSRIVNQRRWLHVHRSI